LLIPSGSKLLVLNDFCKLVGLFDTKALVYPWKNSNPAVDALCEELQEIAATSEQLKRSRSATFERMWRATNVAAHQIAGEKSARALPSHATVPFLNEPWYC